MARRLPPESRVTDERHWERRRYPRIRVFTEIQGRIMPLQEQTTVYDVSLGGFALQSAIGFERGAEHQFEFTMSDGQQAVLRATSVHCMRINRLDSDVLYFAGFAFDRTHAADRSAIDMLVASLTVPVDH
jgi:c-di-GMP-binding flagellar brake protein YcgR